jgi:hypothetical protein
LPTSLSCGPGELGGNRVRNLSSLSDKTVSERPATTISSMTTAADRSRFTCPRFSGSTTLSTNFDLQDGYQRAAAAVALHKHKAVSFQSVEAPMYGRLGDIKLLRNRRIQFDRVTPPQSFQEPQRKTDRHGTLR